jgi:signal transduction histidine kinase
VLVLGIFAALHHGEKAVSDRLRVADTLVTKLEIDREILLRADEELRQQTAKFLHDRVQSNLMVAGIKLKNVSVDKEAEGREIIDQVISLLERTRTIDLKSLTQVLTPNFEANGIEEALNQLGGIYKAEMKIYVSVDKHSEALVEKTQLGIFRITEQALLNSLVHGPAKTVNVSLITNSAGLSVLTISDNGLGAPAQPTKAGVGTAVIDAWVSTMKAKKSIDTVEGHGYQLTIEIPRAE